MVDEHPERADAQHLLGIAYLQTGQPSLAVWPLQKAAEDPELTVAANSLLTTAMLATENFEGAVRAATRALEADPSQSALLHSRARALIGAARAEEGLADADRLLEESPDDYDALLLRAAALSDLKRLDAAEETYLRLRRAGEAEPAYAARGCLALATFYEKDRRDFVRAAKILDECGEAHPDDPLALRLSTEFFDRQGQQAQATRILERALKRTPENLGVRASLARRRVAAGDADEALVLLREAAESQDSFDAWRLLSELYRQLERPEDASRALDRAAAKLPAQGDAEALLFQQADLAIDAGDLDGAQALAGRLAKPEYAELIRGRILLERGDAAGALAALEAGTRLWPNNPYARLLAGSAALRLGQRERAAQHLREATRADGTATDAALLLAELYLADGRFADALSMARRHLTERPTARAEALRVAARAAAGLDRPALALRQLGEALEAGADHRAVVLERAAIAREVDGRGAGAQVLENAGFDLAAAENLDLLRILVADLRAAGRAEEARARIATAWKRQGATPALLALRGRGRLETGDAAGARADFEAALAEDPAEAGALLGTAELERAAGDLDAALALYDRADAAGDGTAAYRAAQAALAAGRRGEAEPRLRAILDRVPAHAHAANDLAWLLAEDGRDLELALELAKRAARLEPAPEILDTLGWVQLTAGRAEAAAVSLRQALDGGSNDPSIWYHLGLAEAAKGDSAAAVEALEQALGAGPFPEADSARAMVESLRGG